MTGYQAPVSPSLPSLVHRALALASRRPRSILGIVGPPGAGKSTLAESLVTAVNAAAPATAVVVPMDGFHMWQADLVRLGRADRKGAPDTFDVAAYVRLLRSLRAAETDIAAPGFDRIVDEPVAGLIAVPRATRLVITEGNYLLCDHSGWGDIVPLLDESWYVEVADEVRIERLACRHAAFGKTAEAARAWAEGSDQRNAEVVEGSLHRASLIVTSIDLRP